MIIMRATGLHNSYPRVIATDLRVWLYRTSISFTNLPLLYENILLSSGCCWIKCHFCMSICFLFRHCWTVLCDGRQDSLIFFAFLLKGKLSALKSESVVIIRVSGHPRSMSSALKC